MGASRVVLVCLLSVLFTGCGYVHFGRAPRLGSADADANLAAAHSDLATEQKILRQELALARKETDTLRAALERAGSTGTAGSTDERLTAALEELTELRAGYARLEAEKSPGVNITRIAETTEKIAELDEKLSFATRINAGLQQEVAQLRQDLARARAENVALDGQLRSLMQRHDETLTALAARDAELTAQTQAARALAEQTANAARAQLGAGLNRGATPASSPEAQPTVPGSAASSPLQLAKAPPAGAVTGDVRSRFENPAGSASPPAVTKSRIHIVQPGDTLEKLSNRYYGAPDRWHVIYEANAVELSSGRPLRPGMELRIPEDAR